MKLSFTESYPQKAFPVQERLFCFLPHLWILIVGGALFQLALSPNLETYNVQRIVQFGLFGISLVLVLWCCFASSPKVLAYSFLFDSRSFPFLTGLAAVVLGAVFSLSGAQMPQWALLDLEYLLLLVIMTWLVSTSFLHSSIKSWQVFGLLVVITMLLYSVRSILDVLIAYPFSNKITATPGFANIRMYADVAVVFIPFSWLALVGDVSLRLRVFVWFISVFWVWVLVLTEARSAILSLSIAVLSVAFRYGKAGRQAFIVSISVLLASVFICLLFPVLSVGGYSRDLTSSSGRFDLWVLAASYFFDSFPAGIGGMMFAADGRYGAAHPHNLLLTLMAEWGALFVAGLFFLMLAALRKRTGWGDKECATPLPLRIPVVMAAISGSINVMFAGAHIIPFSALALVLAWGAYISLSFTSGYSSLKGRGVILLVGLGGFFVWGHASLLAHELYLLSESNREACSAISGYVFPRFWIQGRLDCGSWGV